MNRAIITVVFTAGILLILAWLALPADSDPGKASAAVPAKTFQRRPLTETAGKVWSPPPEASRASLRPESSKGEDKGLELVTSVAGQPPYPKQTGDLNVDRRNLIMWTVKTSSIYMGVHPISGSMIPVDSIAKSLGKELSAVDRNAIVNIDTPMRAELKTLFSQKLMMEGPLMYETARSGTFGVTTTDEGQRQFRKSMEDKYGPHNGNWISFSFGSRWGECIFPYLTRNDAPDLFQVQDKINEVETRRRKLIEQYIHGL